MGAAPCLRLVALATALLFRVPLASAHSAQQPLSTTRSSGRTCTPTFCIDAVERDAFLIFNEIHGLLRQWDNTLAPNGFSYTLATVPANTILYHVRQDELDPSSPEWLAFDYEMGYGIFGTRPDTTFVRTYRTTRDLTSVLYIDGMSAALTDKGTLDSQDILIYATVRDGHYSHEYERAMQLCNWAAQVGVTGFVRQNAGFELLWCDWTDGLQLVLNQNATEWTEVIDSESQLLPSWKDRGSSFVSSFDFKFPLPVDPDEKHPELDLPPFGDYPSRGTDLANYAFWAWYRSATRVYGHLGEQRVRLHTGFHATAYGAAGFQAGTNSSTNSSSGTGPGTLPHTLPRLANMSAETIESFRNEVASLTLTSTSSGTDWRTLTDIIVTRYGEAIAEIHLFLTEGSDWSLRKARLALVTLILPHHRGNVELQSNIDTCVDTLVGDAEGLVSTVNMHERKILQALLHVQRTICTALLDLDMAFDAFYTRSHWHGHSGSTSELQSTTSAFDVHLWSDRLQQLMDVLDWKMWLRCEEVCKWNEICHIPIWPLIALEKRDAVARPKPKCVNWESSGDA